MPTALATSDCDLFPRNSTNRLPIFLEFKLSLLSCHVLWLNHNISLVTNCVNTFCGIFLDFSTKRVIIKLY
nr:MAG TPA: hypothetical protein [Caudoviricetes sp.]DAP89877.1 MAG TPA: hypothetical protein [Bacteriophage sp.]DAV84904.1 MAG TPA: hypothetical protein [Bacteriophage sp.]